MDIEHDRDAQLWGKQFCKHKQCYVTGNAKLDSRGTIATKLSLEKDARTNRNQRRKTVKSWNSYEFVSCSSLTEKFVKSTTRHHALYDAMTTIMSDVAALKTLTGSQEVPDSCSTDQLSLENSICERWDAQRYACESEKRVSAVDLN